MGKENERDVSLDLVSGLLVIHMIVGHADGWAGGGHYPTWIWRVLAFFMPWFFYKAGMMFRGISSFKELKKVAGKSFSRLIVPFLIFSAIGTIFYYCEKLVANEEGCNLLGLLREDFYRFFNESSVSGNLALWFLIALFLVRIFYATLKVLKVSDFLIIVTGFGIAFTLYVQEIFVPFIIAQVALGCSFYALGHSLREKQYRLNTPILATLLACYLMNILFLHVNLDFRANGANSPKYPWFLYLYWFPATISGIILINNLAKHIRWNGISWLYEIGCDSMSYYCIHWILLIILKCAACDVFHIDEQSHGYFCLILCFLVAALPTFNYLLKRQNWLKF